MSVDLCVEGATYHTYVMFCSQSQVQSTYIACVRCILEAVQSHMHDYQSQRYENMQCSPYILQDLKYTSTEFFFISFIIYMVTLTWHVYGRDSRKETNTTTASTTIFNLRSCDIWSTIAVTTVSTTTICNNSKILWIHELQHIQLLEWNKRHTESFECQ